MKNKAWKIVKYIGIVTMAGVLLCCSALVLWKAGSAQQDMSSFEYVELEDGHRYMKVNDLGCTYILADED